MPVDIADHDVVGATERVEVDALELVRIGRDARNVAEELRTTGVREDIDVLDDVSAVELQRVEAVLTFDRVVAVARVPLEHVVAGPEKRAVIAVVAEHEVRALAPSRTSLP